MNNNELRRRAAFHEAGHAVVALALGMDLYRVGLAASQTTGQEGGWTRVGYDDGCDADSQATYAQAGSLAGYYCTLRGCRPSRRRATRWQQIVVGGLSASDEVFTREGSRGARRRADVLVRENWEWIARVAEHLVEHEAADEVDVLALRDPQDIVDAERAEEDFRHWLRSIGVEETA